MSFIRLLYFLALSPYGKGALSSPVPNILFRKSLIAISSAISIVSPLPLDKNCSSTKMPTMKTAVGFVTPSKKFG